MLLKDIERFSGISNPFAALAVAANAAIINARNDINKPDILKKQRLFSKKEALAMIGRTSAWGYQNAELMNGWSDQRGRYYYYSLDWINNLRNQLGTMPMKRPAGAPPLIGAVTNFKGGVGKSTNTAHKAQYLAMQGLNVLLVDLDSQGSATHNLSNLHPDQEISAEQVLTEALTEDPYAITDCIMHTYFPNVDLVPSNSFLSDCENRLNMQSESDIDILGHPIERLNSALQVLNEGSTQYDVVLIDCPPNMGVFTANALACANMVLTPVKPESLDTASLSVYMTTLARFYEQRGQLPDIFRILITMDDNKKAANAIKNSIHSVYSDVVLNESIKVSEEVKKASGALCSIYGLEKPFNRDAYNRARTSFDNAFSELADDINDFWSQFNE